ncbi:trehalase family glycosidase [Clostridium lacusfryxellense]|uniref:trehalase family glycosidase n=1 Tax=Clostridium lacusfryxellense TaxID=205328 RepID=UPI001C0CE38B|nr:trehalase family glycosidase [Clostridium lacusfryxellense]MBU3112060.1 hypothetical protein [Clostridium lacusfryxellense]
MNNIEHTEIESVLSYIKNNWIKTVRNNVEDEGTLLGMPYPYVVPSISGGFQEMYYWDTYFTNQGLLRQGFENLAKSNTDNILYMVSKYGFMPNGNRELYLNRSQPPYLSMMVRDVFNIYKDKEWLERAYETLKIEYDFWMKKRITPIGLNRYFVDADTETELGMFEHIYNRMPQKVKPIDVDEDAKALIGRHYIAECESGWDFNPRFEGRCTDFIPVDLNCNLFIYEKNFEYFSTILNKNEDKLWKDRAEKRKELVNKYCWDETRKLFVDYDFINNAFSKVESLAVFHPLWVNLASQQQAESTVKNIEIFENPFGLATCKPGERDSLYQWDYPNGWAPLQYIAAMGLMNYGYKDDAKRIAEKYVNTVIKNYGTTNKLWEKYNVIDGTINVANEYEMPSMLGWTAGVFIALEELI